MTRLWRMIGLCCVLLPLGVQASPVTFQVDLGPFLAAGYFAPGSDCVEVRGDFNGWAGGAAPLQAVAGGSAYAGTVDVPAGTIAYKFVIMRGCGAVVWEDDIPNRSWVVPAEGGATPAVDFDDLATTLDPTLRVVGADLSGVPQLLSLGASFSREGSTEPVLSLVKRAGIQLVRLRLWHTPSEHWNGLESTVAFARQLQAAGFDLMLDLHYSDTWADPGQQTPPVAWQGISVEALADSVTAYTTSVIDRFNEAGVVLRYIQLGNEIDAGMLWDQGRVGWPGSAWDNPAQWAALTRILQAASAAARASLPGGAPTELILHVSSGGDNARCRWFFDEITAAGVDFDMIGLSYYPWWHGSLWDLRTNLRDLGPRYGKKMMVVETAYPWTLAAADTVGNFVTKDTILPDAYPATPLGQLDFLRDVRRVTETSGGLGVIYWEPAFVPVPGGPPNPYENLTLFDFEGGALPGLDFGATDLTPAP